MAIKKAQFLINGVFTLKYNFSILSVYVWAWQWRRLGNRTLSIFFPSVGKGSVYFCPRVEKGPYGEAFYSVFTIKSSLLMCSIFDFKSFLVHVTMHNWYKPFENLVFLPLTPLFETSAKFSPIHWILFLSYIL